MSVLRLFSVLPLVAALAATAQAAPYVPAGDAVVLERLPIKANDPIARKLRALRAELAGDPRNLDVAEQLAWEYFALANSEGDPRYIGYAEAALKPWWDLPAPPIEVLVLRALLLQYRHDFSHALADFDAALKLDPHNMMAWSWRAAIDMVEADYAAARVDCEGLRDTALPLWVAGCIASVDGVTGKAEEAYRALAAALAREPDASPEAKLWALTRLAEFSERMGKPDQAERHFKQALALPVTDQFLLALYADFLLDHDRPQEVLDMLKDWVRSDVLLLRLALAAKAAKAPSEEEYSQALKSRFDAAALRGDKLHQQEEARMNLYLLGRRDEALRLASENWLLQREPRDARILMEAALAAGKPAAARPALEWMEKSGHEDPYMRQLAAKLKGAK